MLDDQLVPRVNFQWLRCLVPTSVLAIVLWVVGCQPPETAPAPPQKEEPPRAKAPATTPYGQAFEATERLKDKVKDYNDRLEELNDPFAK